MGGPWVSDLSDIVCLMFCFFLEVCVFFPRKYGPVFIHTLKFYLNVYSIHRTFMDLTKLELYKTGQLIFLLLCLSDGSHKTKILIKKMKKIIMFVRADNLRNSTDYLISPRLMVMV